MGIFSSPAPASVLTSADAFAIVNRSLSPRFYTPDTPVRLADKGYTCIASSVALRCVRNAYASYREHTMDCDDFAFLAKAEAILYQRDAKLARPAALGIIWTMTHAMAFFIDGARTLRILDNDGTEKRVSSVREITLAVM